MSAKIVFRLAILNGWDLPRHLHHFGPGALQSLLERAGFAPGVVRYEWYSLLSRSLANRWRSGLSHRERRTALRFGPLEALWGLTLAACRTSSALQVVARAARAA